RGGKGPVGRRPTPAMVPRPACRRCGTGWSCSGSSMPPGAARTGPAGSRFRPDDPGGSGSVQEIADGRDDVVAEQVALGFLQVTPPQFLGPALVARPDVL